MIIIFAACSLTAIGQDALPPTIQTAYRPGVMILGTFHFGSSGDNHRPPDPDILSAGRQAEIESLIENIARFRPTKILVERDRISGDSAINEQYRMYLDGAFDISVRANEIYQIAFRLARRLGHERIYCSDADAPWFGTDDIDWDNFDEQAYLLEKGQYEKAEKYDYTELYNFSDSLQMNLSVGKYLAFLNTPSTALKYHQVYLTNIVLAGAGDNYYGADSVGKWYRRNLRIFSNLYDIADFDGPQRILMIYGASHIWTLRQFIMDSPLFDYIEAGDYL